MNDRKMISLIDDDIIIASVISEIFRLRFIPESVVVLVLFGKAIINIIIGGLQAFSIDLRSVKRNKMYLSLSLPISHHVIT